MNAMTPMIRAASTEASLWDNKQVALIRRTMAKDATNDEFDVFMSMARALRLDPLRKQVYCFIFNKNDPDKRNMVLVTAISGFRSIAERTGNYRPDSEAPVYHIFPWKVERDKAIVEAKREIAAQRDAGKRHALEVEWMTLINETYPIDPLNPEGIEKAVVRVFKFSHGEWHAITAEAYWSEYAPVKDGWVENGTDNNGKTRWKPSGEKTLDTSGPWGKRPRGQISKCAEGLALRMGWSDDFSNVYAEEEIDKQKFIDLLPNEMADLGAQEARLERVQTKDCVLISWQGTASEAPEEVPMGALPDRVFEFIERHRETPQVLADWEIRNRHALRMMWAARKSDALEIKKRLEHAVTAKAA